MQVQLEIIYSEEGLYIHMIHTYPKRLGNKKGAGGTALKMTGGSSGDEYVDMSLKIVCGQGTHLLDNTIKTHLTREFMCSSTV